MRFRKLSRDVIANSIVTRFYNSPEEGAGGGSSDPSAPPTSETSVRITGGEPSGIPDNFVQQALENDSEYAALVKKDKAAETDKDKGVEVDLAKTPEGENTDTGEQTTPPDKPADEKNSGSESEVSFEDNVIDGLKGEDFSALKPEAQEAVAKFYSKAKESETALSDATGKLDRLLKDPVVRARAEMLDSGRDKFNVRGITNEEKDSIVQRLQAKIGLTEEEACGAFEELEGGIKNVVSAMAEDATNNLLLQKHKQQEAQQTVRKGMDLLLKLGELNPDLAIKEKDLNKFFTKEGFNEAHPEIAQFKKGLGPFMQMCGKLGIGYDRIIDLENEVGLEGIYALVAAKTKLPVSLNSGDRDKKLVADAKMKALRPFLKNAGPKTLYTESGTIKDRGAAEKTVKFDGYDAARMANDPDYYERALNEKPGNRAHKAKIDSIAEKGDLYIREKQRTKK